VHELRALPLGLGGAAMRRNDLIEVVHKQAFMYDEERGAVYGGFRARREGRRVWMIFYRWCFCAHLGFLGLSLKGQRRVVGLNFGSPLAAAMAEKTTAIYSWFL
jgi:hypothetical protein